MKEKTKLFIDLPNNFTDKYLLQQKVFEYIERRPTKYIKDFKILYIQNKSSSRHIEKLIKDWDLDGQGYNAQSLYGQGLYEIVTNIANNADEALIFRDGKIGIESKIAINACDNVHGLYLNVYRIDWDSFAR